MRSVIAVAVAAALLACVAVGALTATTEKRMRLVVHVARVHEEAEIEGEFVARSSPESPLFRQFLTRAELRELVRGKDESVRAVMAYLREIGATGVELVRSGDAIVGDVTTGVAAGLGYHGRGRQSVELPAAVAAHVRSAIVVGLRERRGAKKHAQWSGSSSSSGYAPSSGSAPPDMRRRPGLRPPDMRRRPGLRPPDMRRRPGLRPPDMRRRPGLRPPDMRRRPGLVLWVWILRAARDDADAEHDPPAVRGARAERAADVPGELHAGRGRVRGRVLRGQRHRCVHDAVRDAEPVDPCDGAEHAERGRGRDGGHAGPGVHRGDVRRSDPDVVARAEHEQQRPREHRLQPVVRAGGVADADAVRCVDQLGLRVRAVRERHAGDGGGQRRVPQAGAAGRVCVRRERRQRPGGAVGGVQLQHVHAELAVVVAVPDERWRDDANSTSDEEVSVNWSGGGFSTQFTRPSWQAAAVKKYFEVASASLPPQSFYAANGRGYPDVSALGANFDVVVAGQWQLVSGTSAASPTFAGVVSLIVAERLAKGQSALGFLNPKLYQLGRVGYDVVEGASVDTNCDTGTLPGFPTAAGWDAVSGLGTPSYTYLRANL
eukprot:CAMPEP_0176426888 /NCGR_PEP_ID=MMETSP0127-20121128/12204_1 /TAXON_ID=938130 /ORGANISM="Platyophrya macrostoma, Strain WH" /LENGTH=602 /DNA_ID=CAMNT_0017808229 /DNA_START=43 /DNA_END=1854 /DNA_ORIENTATION=-